MEKRNPEIVEKVFECLMAQPYGTKISLREAYETVYSKEGYVWVRHESKGWVSSNNGGKTYLIEDMDLFEILNEVEIKLKEKNRILDFSEWENMCVGLPYNLQFVITRKK